MKGQTIIQRERETERERERERERVIEKRKEGVIKGFNKREVERKK